MRDDSDLVITANGGEDCPDAWISKCRVEISGTVFSGCAESAGRREFHWHEAGRVGEPIHGLLVNCWREAGSGE